MTMMGTEQLMPAVSGLFMRDDLFGVEVSAEISNASGAGIQPPERKKLRLGNWPAVHGPSPQLSLGLSVHT
jgi:hypothetical protein